MSYKKIDRASKGYPYIICVCMYVCVCVCVCMYVVSQIRADGLWLKSLSTFWLSCRDPLVSVQLQTWLLHTNT
jgi:uncharacterized membrane protein YjjP (DUF1212 family)